LMPSDFGAAQITAFKKDFSKLRETAADLKYMFVTEAEAFRLLLKPKYCRQLPGVSIVLLPTGDEHAG
jgi:hypothetical protein